MTKELLEELEQQRRDINEKINKMKQELRKADNFIKKEYYQVTVKITVPMEEGDEFDSALKSTGEAVKYAISREFDWEPEGYNMNGVIEQLDNRIVMISDEEFDNLPNDYVHRYGSDTYNHQFDNIDKELRK